MMDPPTPTTGPSSPRRHHYRRPSQPLPPSPRKLVLRKPADGSLLALLRQHPGTPLFVRPICWTDQHVRLLNARFHPLPACDAPRPASEPGSPPTPGHMRPSPTITALSDALTEIARPLAATPVMMMPCAAVTTVLGTLWPRVFKDPIATPELHLCFGDRIYYDVARVQAMWNYPPASPSSPCSSPTASPAAASPPPPSCPDTGPNLPMMCYVSKQQLFGIRRSLFKVVRGPGANPNLPVLQLQLKRWRKFIPSNPDQDPHFVAIFLAMAQKHFHASSSSSSSSSPPPPPPPPPLDASPNPSAHPKRNVTLRILSHCTDTASFLVYTGHIPPSLLASFHDPSSCPPDPPGMTIEYTAVPIWPILGLRERLGQALGEDIVGPIDPLVMETWEDDQRKRKRRRMSDGLEEGKKRRIHHHRVGVVV